MKPPVEKIEMTLGFIMQASPFSPQGVVLRIEDSERKLIGEVLFSRADLGDLLSGRGGVPGIWSQYRPLRSES